jgi:hypothetical protein
MKGIVRDEIEIFSIDFGKRLKVFDDSLVRLRSDVNIHNITKEIDRKANKDQVSNDFSNHEFKISTLDRNFIRIAADFETIQLAINKLHQAIVELQDANRDVLLGKRTTNCLSCGKGGDNGNQQITGKDGRVYKGMPGAPPEQNIRNSNLGPLEKEGSGNAAAPT